MKSHKIEELIGWQLDMAVARAEGRARARIRIDDYGERCVMQDDGVGDHGRNPDVPFRPSSDWTDGGPIIERERIAIEHCNALDWSALHGDTFSGNWPSGGPILFGPTPLIAAMRAYITSKFGEAIDLPD